MLRGMRHRDLVHVLGLAISTYACSGSTPPAAIDAAALPSFSFFITSTGGPSGGDFRLAPADLDGLAGADALCQAKATAAVPAAASKTWRAYLSTDKVNARDRIGAGPWFNRAGVMVASSVANLHDAAANMLNKANSTDENGAVVNGRGDLPNQHDILTGSTAAGMAIVNNNCANWTSSAAAGVTAQVGHHDRQGGGADPTSWGAAHASNGCSGAALAASGGRGSIYCFAAN
jgi:hypothetical protein